MTRPLKLDRAALVRHGGMASVFRVFDFSMSASKRHAALLLQGHPDECETFCRGLAAAGVEIHVYACAAADEDIAAAQWTPIGERWIANR
jgi:hypothetical protein